MCEFLNFKFELKIIANKLKAIVTLSISKLISDYYINVRNMLDV